MDYIGRMLAAATMAKAIQIFITLNDVEKGRVLALADKVMYAHNNFNNPPNSFGDAFEELWTSGEDLFNELIEREKPTK